MWKRVNSGLARHALVVDGAQVAFVLAPTGDGKHRWTTRDEVGSCDSLAEAKAEVDRRVAA